MATRPTDSSSPAPSVGTPVQKVGQDQAKATLAVLSDQLKALVADLAATQAFVKSPKGPPEVLNAAKAKVSTLLIQQKQIGLRIGLLKKGLDIAKPPELHPSHAEVQRPQLVLPPIHAVPPAAVVSAASKAVAAAVPKLSGESSASHAVRQQAIMQRAMVRVVNTQAANPLASPAAVVQAAVAETVKQDLPAITSEAAASGGDSSVATLSGGSKSNSTLLLAGFGALVLGALVAKKQGWF